MDLRKVKKLIELLEASALLEMEITEGDSTIRLSRATSSSGTQPVQQHSSSSHVSVEPPSAGSAQHKGSELHAVEITGNVVESPMVGTFYNSASPDTEPYVEIGSVVKPGDIICIIEAMKTFNQLEADVAGTIKAIYKSNGDPVEFGEPIFLID